MQKQANQIDSINVLLEECIIAFPVSSFIISLYKQYQNRGSLSKKQLQGLHSKASKIVGLAPGKLAAVEAIIKKMPTRFKSEKPAPAPMYEKDEKVGKMLSDILQKYPTHKRVLFLKSKYDLNDPLTSTELSDLKKIQPPAIPAYLYYIVFGHQQPSQPLQCFLTAATRKLTWYNPTEWINGILYLDIL